MPTENTETDTVGLPYLDTEQEFQDFLEAKFETHGFDAIQEVTPRNSKYRADLLLLHDEYGPIGLELKRLTGGSDAGKAHQQIVRQYAGRKYINRRVKLWAFAPYMPKLQVEMDEGTHHGFQRGKLEVLEHFFQRYGIGVLDVHSHYAQLKWGATNEYMLPAFGLNTEVTGVDTDMEKIRKRVSERLYPDRDIF